jgi:N-acetylglucosaminyldiphosphoundecaprenol N-acetyl-beta-D-mannosaminyltransferase
VATVHTVMEAHDDPDYRSIVNSADLVTSDGMPLVWGLRALGLRAAARIYGPDLTRALLDRSARAGVPVGFYGGSPRVLSQLLSRIGEEFPALMVAYAWSPPFRKLTVEEEADAVRSIQRSGARILFVGLGCPKQERWMARMRGPVPAVMVGVGAAFDFIAEVKPQAPAFVQRAGLEWLFRLGTEPRRLWRRYLYHNPRFILLFGRQLWQERAQDGVEPVPPRREGIEGSS